jgi:AcrR family transcriptional regulator
VAVDHILPTDRAVGYRGTYAERPSTVKAVAQPADPGPIPVSRTPSRLMQRKDHAMLPGLDAADVRRKEIADAAAHLFDTGGYFTASMGDIASAVGIAKPTLYHYFRGKDEILLHIHHEFIGLLLSRHEARASRGSPAVTELLGLMTDMLDLMQTHPGHVRAFFEHHRELPPERRQEVRAKRDAYMHVVESTIRRGIDQGDVREVNVPIAALAVFGMCNWAYQWFRPQGSLSTGEIAEMFWDFITNGLTPRAHPGSDVEAPVA